MKTLETTLDHLENLMDLFGTSDKNLKLIEEELNISVTTRGETIKITGEEADIELAKAVIDQLLFLAKNGITIGGRDVTLALAMAKKGTLEYLEDLYK